MEIFENFEYNIGDEYEKGSDKEVIRKYAVVFKYMGNETKVTVPSEIEGIPVTTMVDSFTKREEMEEIILPEQLEKISYGCFRECKKITKITLPETLTSIGTEAFSGCSSLEKVICSENPQWLEQITLGNRDLGQNIFENCPKLCNENGFVLLHSLLVGYDGRNTEVTIPNTVTKIADFTFWEQKKLKSVTVFDSVKTLGSGVFFKCQGLKEVILPDGIKIFPNETFRSCTSLESIVFPEKLEEVHNDVFHSCSKLKNIQWNKNLKFFGDGSFSKCTSLEEIHFPNSIDDIGKAFTGCDKLKEITIPTNVTLVRGKAFAKCKNLEKVNILPRQEGDTRHFTTQTGCFSYTIPMQERFLTQGEAPQSRVISGFNKGDEEKFRLDQIKMWEHLPQEEKNFFLEDWKKKVTTKVKQGNNRLRNLVFLQSTVKEMSVYFKEGCNLELSELEEYLEFSIKNENTAETALLLDYKNKTYSKDYLDELETRKDLVDIGLELPTLKELREKWTVTARKDHIIINGYHGKSKVEILPPTLADGTPIRKINKTYDGFKTLEKLTLPEGIEEIGESAFNETSLEVINIPSTVTYIGTQAFSETKITEITLPSSLDYVNDGMFSECEQLEKVILPDTITMIFSFAFNDCCSLTEIHIPEGVIRIKNGAFNGCHKLKNIFLPDNVEIIESDVFEECYSLEEIRLPASLKSLGDCAFQGCSNLKKVILPSENVKIGKKVWWDCPSLEFIGVEGGENLLPSFQK